LGGGKLLGGKSKIENGKEKIEKLNAELAESAEYAEKSKPAP
jgi:hypothetical protein